MLLAVRSSDSSGFRVVSALSVVSSRARTAVITLNVRRTVPSVLLLSPLVNFLPPALTIVSAASGYFSRRERPSVRLVQCSQDTRCGGICAREVSALVGAVPVCSACALVNDRATTFRIVVGTCTVPACSCAIRLRDSVLLRCCCAAFSRLIWSRCSEVSEDSAEA
eukprot:1789164-Rhodomonas_salina.1